MLFISYTVLVLILSLTQIKAMDPQWLQHTGPYSHSNESLIKNHQTFGTIDGNLTEFNQNNSQIDYSGRSAKSMDFDKLFQSNDEGGREPRIINDKDLSIKGFIPIVGFGNDKHDSQEQPSKQDQSYDFQSFVDQNSYSDYNKNGFPQSSQTDKHMSRPEDQRFIGAALQGLTASLKPKPSRKQGFGYDSNYGFNSLNTNENCICVPFYLCKNGYLTEAKNSGLKSPNIQTAQSILNQFAIPAPQTISQKYSSQQKPSSHQNPFEQYLPIDERSNDDLLISSNQQIYSQTQNNSAPQYADEVLARMLGVRSDGCGVLRTCCRQQPIPEITEYQFASNYPIPEPNEFNKRFQNPFQPNVQQIPSYVKPERPHKYETHYSHQMPIEAYPSQVVQSSYGFAPKPLNPIRDLDNFQTRPLRPLSPQIPVPLRPGYPSIQPLRPEPGFQSFKPDPTLHSFDGIGSPESYGVCGKRHSASVGVHGRVQNLQYHESSTEFGEFPWQAAILKRLGPADSLYVCGGALISPLYIVTAAHCLKKFHPKDLKVRLGEWDVHREDEFYPYVEKYIEDIVIHPDFFAGNLLNDIALIKLESPVEFNHSPHIAPVCLPEAFEKFAGQRCFVSGWGKNSFGHQGEFQSVLTKVDVPVLNHGECEHALRRTRLGYNYHLHPSMVCAGGEPGKDACEGDGGSGLVCDVRGVWKVVGLVSWGVGCGKPGVPGVYTNMAYLKPWIDSHVLKYSPGFGSPLDNYEPGFGIISERSSAKSNNITHIEEQENREESDTNVTPITTTSTDTSV